MDSFNAQCERETRTIMTRLSVRYSRQPSKRQEQRLPMDTADDLERRRRVMAMTEFSATWNKRDGELP